MKKLYLILLLAFMAPWLAIAQSPQGRLPKTIVADVLARMPAKNVKIYDQMMKDLVSSGAEGLQILTDGMLPDSQKDNTATGYAIGGLSYFVTTPGKSADRKLVNDVLVRALDKATDRDVKAFFIRQLQIVGDDQTLPTLGKYALTKDLSQEAVAAIVEIGTPKSKTMIESLFENIPDKSIAVYALGDLGITTKEKTLLSWLGSSDDKLQKSVLYTLARTGSPKSTVALAKAAKAVNYTFEPTGATESYLEALKRNPNEKELRKLLSNSDANIRTSAIQTLANAYGAKVLPDVLNALNDPSRPYRNAALAAAAPYAKSQFYQDLLERMPTDYLSIPIAEGTGANTKKAIDPEMLVDVMNFIGLQKLQGATTRITPYLTASNKELRVAAITALNRIDQPEGRTALVSRLIDNDPQKIAEIKDALLWSKSIPNSAIAAIIPNASEAGKVAAIEVLAAKRANESLDVVLGLTSVVGKVENAAYSALPNLVSKNELQKMCSMLADTSKPVTPANKSNITKAIGAILSDMPKDQALAAIKPYLAQSPIFYQTLVYIGSNEALSILKDEVKNNGANKDIALNTIVGWNDFNASATLFDIYAKGDQNYAKQALASYIRVMKQKNFNDTKRFIYLRKAIDVAKNADDKNLLLSEIAKCTDFNALLLAGKYIDDQATVAAAGNAVYRIALKDATYKFWGDDVKAILQKFLKVRKGGDAPYEISAVEKYLSEAPKTTGFVSIFNGKDLTGWKGLVKNPIARAKMTPQELATEQIKADEIMRKGWEVKDGILYFTGHGDNLCTEKQYGDFEMYVDWVIQPDGDAGIYLRGSPQVQVWDTCRRDVGAQIGSGGLYNNSKNPSKPLVLADNAIGDWNTFYIKMVGERVTVCLNGILVVDNVILENYWDRKQPIFPVEQLELQAHGTIIGYRDIYVKELPKQEPFKLSAQEQADGFKVLFDGISMNEWIGNTKDYVTENGTITLYPGNGGGGNLYTKKEYADFIYRFEFMLTPAANNGLGIRTPLTGDAAYVGTELQILDSEHPVYKDLEPYQYHGSAYGIIPAKRGYLKPVGEWNYQEVIVKGNHVKVTLNGTVILDGDMDEASKNGTADKKDHPGLKNATGHIGFLGHGSVVKFKNIRIKEL